jgi:nucleotide-binding universal stress UspA family protein
MTPSAPTGARPVSAGRTAPSAPPLSRVVVGFDASPPSTRAARLAVEIARGGRARLWLVFAQQVDPRLAEPRTEEEVSTPVRAASKAMDALVLEARAAGTTAEAVVREGDPATVLLAVARELGADMIVVGTRGLGAAARVLLGSVSSRVVAEASVPVTVVP